MKTLLHIILLISFFTNSYAQAPSKDTETLFNDLKFAKSMWKMESLPKLEEWKVKCGPGSFDFYCETENSKKYFEFRSELERRSKSGDPLAYFYFGVLVADDADNTSASSSDAVNRQYDQAIALFKLACAQKIYAGCYNVGLFLLQGQGSIKSGLASIEWFYKSGVGYSQTGDRERAYQSLEKIKGVDAKNALGNKLQAMIEKDSPK